MHKSPITPTGAPFAVAAAAALSLLALTATAQLPTASPNGAAIPADSPGGIQSAVTSATPMGIAKKGEDAHAQPSEAEMMQMMMEMGKVNDNHKLLAELVGDWSYVVKIWMAPGAAPTESKGTATRKAEMGGHYFIGRATGKFQMPGADGKMTDMNFEGMSIDGYDNAKQKFFSAWIDNMGTGILLAEGTYDPATKTFSYHGDYDMAPGMKMKVRETIRVTDKDHYVMEYFENRGGQDVKTMEIDYTRTK
ncbi:MAG: DUF1579 domain-containing protein [Chthoniobacterales bacterium]